MKRYLLFPLLLTVITAKTQNLIVTIDASNRRTKDTLVINHHHVVVHPGKITTSTLPIQTPAELQFDEIGFVGANDSIHISYDRQQQRYTIDGGRYPDNYRAFTDLIATFGWRDAFLFNIGYNEYVLNLDTLAGNRLAAINEEKARGSLSPDVADYLTAYLKYGELVDLISYQSKTHQEIFPATHSSLYPTVTPDDFRQDRYTRIWPYISCIIWYLSARFKSANQDSSLTREIDFTIDSLSGDTRARVLNSLIVETGYKPKNNKAAFTALYHRIRELHLAAVYATGIERQYKKAMLEHQPISSNLLNQPLLRTPAGRSISLRSILDTCQNEDLFIKFAEFGLEVQAGGYMDIKPIVANPRIITVDLCTSFRHWQRHTKDRILTNEFYLVGGLKNPLKAYLFINNLPTWVALSRTGKVDDIDISLEDMFRYDLAEH